MPGTKLCSLSSGRGKILAKLVFMRGEYMNRVDFDRLIDRRGTASAKWDTLPQTGAGEPAYIALSTADMDFAVPSVISEALERVVARRI